MYGSYILYADYGGFTRFQYLGDPYVGVTINSETLFFNSVTDLSNLLVRLGRAYEDHSEGFFDSNISLTDVELDALIDATWFDENLPLRELEGYFNLSSYRALIEAGEQAFLNGTSSTDPDLSAVTADEILRTVLNTSAGIGIDEAVSFVSHSTWLGGPGECHSFMREWHKPMYAPGKKIKYVGEYHANDSFRNSHGCKN